MDEDLVFMLFLVGRETNKGDIDYDMRTAMLRLVSLLLRHSYTRLDIWSLGRYGDANRIVFCLFTLFFIIRPETEGG